MKIDKFLDKNRQSKKELGYDLVDDLAFFMNNDPTFYRKKYYPTMLKFDKFCKKGLKVAPRGFEPLVREAYTAYCQKFPVEGLEKELSTELREKLCAHIHEQETKNCQEGMYDLVN